MQIRRVWRLVQYFRLASRLHVRFGIRDGLLFLPREEGEKGDISFRDAQKSWPVIICGRAISPHCGSLRRTAGLSKLAARRHKISLPDAGRFPLDENIPYSARTGSMTRETCILSNNKTQFPTFGCKLGAFRTLLLKRKEYRARECGKRNF